MARNSMLTLEREFEMVPERVLARCGGGEGVTGASIGRRRKIKLTIPRGRLCVCKTQS